MKLNTTTGIEDISVHHNLQRALEKRAKEDSDGEALSPKKTRSSASLDRKNFQCVYCETFQTDSDEPIHRTSIVWPASQSSVEDIPCPS